MRRKLLNLKNRGGINHQNGAYRTLVDLVTYRTHADAVYIAGTHYDSQYDGWSWATRPRDQPIFLRRARQIVTSPSGPA